MATAGDIAGTARILLDGGLAVVGESVVLSPKIARFVEKADRVTLVGIAALLLKRFPPGWIVTAVVDGQVLPELIPDFDRDRLAWLGADLIPLILDVHDALTSRTDDELRKQIGNAGELAVLSALRRAGHDPIHVALVSDVYGYDIEYPTISSVSRIEVKSAFQSTSDRIFVSRNEFDKACAYGISWKLIQVVFSSGIILQRKATVADVLTIRELPSAALQALAPADSAYFSWTEGAEFKPGAARWSSSELVVGDGYEVSIGKGV